jgi:hypothetical protein
MYCTKAPSQPWGIPATNGFFSANEASTWPSGISKLQFEKEILENGLANCVTYLQVLRKKQAQTELRLVTNPSLSRKKRKKMQQSRRELEKEIKHRERDEQAFLNNLQACKANIYIAETVSLPATGISSTVPDIASTSTRYSYTEDTQTEPTEISWNGWTGETVLSPFQKESNNPFFTDDVAPEERSESGKIGGIILEKSKQSLSFQRLEDVETRPRVSPNTQTHALLNAEAAVFQPQLIHTGQGDAIDQQVAQLRLSLSMTITTLKIEALKLLERGLVGDTGIVPAHQQISLASFDKEASIQTGAKSTTQQSPNKVAIARNLKIRTSSL